MIITETMRLPRAPTTADHIRYDYDIIAERIITKLANLKILEVSEFHMYIDADDFWPRVKVTITFDDSIYVDVKTNKQTIIDQIIMNSF